MKVCLWLRVENNNKHIRGKTKARNEIHSPDGKQPAIPFVQCGQGRFRSPVVQDGDHLLVVLRYIEAYPVRAALVADPCEYTWSSHRCHGAGHADPLLDSFPEWEQLGRTEPERRTRWRRQVRGEQPAKELDGVRSSVRSGRPYGAEDCVEVSCHRLGIVREPRRRGRPPCEKML